mgnify:CR=1 FL=1
MVGSRKYPVAVSGIIFVVLVTASCARQDEISEAPPAQQTSLPRQDSEAAELVEAGQGTADLRARAEQGDAEAQLTLGGMYFAGQGVAEDAVEGVRWWRQAAEQGHLAAQSGLGGRYFNGRGVEQDEAEAFRWYRMAAEQGDEEVLAFMHLNAEQGLMVAQANLAEMYAEGRGVVRDEMEALRWWWQAVPQSPVEVLVLIRRAAERGSVAAKVTLGRIYATGRGVSHDAGEAMRWYRLAAEQGSAEAQVTLGDIYLDGRGVAQDTNEAMRWYRRAAEQGWAEAQIILGSMYGEGRGVVQNEEQATRWYRQAAEQGWSDAQFTLGGLYFAGRDIPRNEIEAVKWYHRAAHKVIRGRWRGSVGLPRKAMFSPKSLWGICIGTGVVLRRTRARRHAGIAWPWNGVMWKR